MRLAKISAWPWESTSPKTGNLNHKVLSNKSTPENGYKPRTELGKRLMQIREEAIAEGMALKSLEELEKDNEE